MTSWGLQASGLVLWEAILMVGPRGISIAWSVEVIQLWIDTYIAQGEHFSGPVPHDLCVMPLEAISEHGGPRMLSVDPQVAGYVLEAPRMCVLCLEEERSVVSGASRGSSHLMDRSSVSRKFCPQE